MTLLGTPWAGKLDPETDPASGTLMESWLDAIQAVIDGNIDFNNVNASANIPITALATGPWVHNAGSSVVRKILRGKKSITTGGAASASASVTFGTPSGGDHDDPTGVTAFKAATVPVCHVTAIGVGTGTGHPIVAYITTTPTNTNLTIGIKTSDITDTLPDPVVVHWSAEGEE